MKKISRIQWLLVAFCVGLFSHPVAAQIYPEEFLLNGCNYAYNGLSFNPGDSLHIKNGNYQLVFEDDFDGNRLDTTKWTTCYPWGGRALENAQSGTGWERQYYTDQNVSVNGGFLHLVTQTDAGYRSPDPEHPAADVFFKYTSGMICSRQLFKEGKFEISCKIPIIDGVWPAFWLAGSCKQEIDGFEFNNKDLSSNATEDSGDIIMSYHKQNHCGVSEGGQCDNGFTRNMGVDLSAGFHVYTVEWDENKIIWQLDGRNVREVYRIWKISPPLPNGPLYGSAEPVKNPAEMDPFQDYTVFNAFPTPDVGMNFTLNTAVGFDRGIFPKEFLIDYVKIYVQSDTTLPFLQPVAGQLSVFPNPVKNKISIIQPDKEDPILDAIVLNVLGEVVNCAKTIEADHATVDLFLQPAGVYIIRIVCRKGYELKKIIHN